MRLDTCTGKKIMPCLSFPRKRQAARSSHLAISISLPTTPASQSHYHLSTQAHPTKNRDMQQQIFFPPRSQLNSLLGRVDRVGTKLSTNHVQRQTPTLSRAPLSEAHWGLSSLCLAAEGSAVRIGMVCRSGR